MKRLSFILIFALVAFAACTKSKEVYPEKGDGNDEIVTVGMKDVHVKYMRTDHEELQKVLFHYSFAEVQHFTAMEMTKQKNYFELTVNNLLSNTLYCYYYELFPSSSSTYQSEQKTFHTQAFDQPQPPTPVAELPKIITAEVSEITTNSAKCGGIVIDDGGAEVIDRGICWSTNENPSLNNNHVAVTSGAVAFYAMMNGLEANTTYYVRAYAINERGIAYGLDKEFITPASGGGGGGSGDHDCVDLGLPSGTLWATYNIGAYSPEEYGDYFAWGEIQPKDYYAWTNYQLCNSSPTTLTKYCNKTDYGYNGFTDNLTTLLPCDDAATANWGDGWCMPTREQWQELYQNTTKTWTSQNSVNGMLFTAINGNCLFLPASGSRFGDWLNGTGNNGSYWSSTLGPDNPGHAWFFTFLFSDGYLMNYNGRLCGQSVRAVRSSK